MKNIQSINNQQGSVMIIALIALMLLAFFTSSGVNAIMTEGKTTSLRAVDARMSNLADLALRNAERTAIIHGLDAEGRTATEMMDCDLLNDKQICFLTELDKPAVQRAYYDDPKSVIGATSGNFANVISAPATNGSKSWKPIEVGDSNYIVLVNSFSVKGAEGGDIMVREQQSGAGSNIYYHTALVKEKTAIAGSKPRELIVTSTSTAYKVGVNQ